MDSLFLCGMEGFYVLGPSKVRCYSFSVVISDVLLYYVMQEVLLIY